MDQIIMAHDEEQATGETEDAMALASPEEAAAAGISLRTDTNLDEALKVAQASGQAMRLRIALAFYKKQAWGTRGYVNAHGYGINGLTVAPDEGTIKALWACVELAVQKCAQDGIGPQRVREALEAL